MNRPVVPHPKRQSLDEIRGEIRPAHPCLRERDEIYYLHEVQDHPPEVAEEKEVRVVPSSSHEEHGVQRQGHEEGDAHGHHQSQNQFDHHAQGDPEEVPCESSH